MSTATICIGYPAFTDVRRPRCVGAGIFWLHRLGRCGQTLSNVLVNENVPLADVGSSLLLVSGHQLPHRESQLGRFVEATVVE